MYTKFTRIVIPFIGVTFGFFIGCSTLFPSSKNSQPQNNFTGKELKAELESVNRQIGSGQQNADLYYQKGYLLSELAQKTEEPGQRSTIYKEMYQALKSAEQSYEDSNLPSGKQKVDELLKVTWSKEHNKGVQIIQTDSTLKSDAFERAAAHFNNATLILPDTAISYTMEARTHYQNHAYDQAISALERARQTIDRLPSEMLEQLAFLYLKDEQPRKAITVYEEAESFSDDNLNLIHGLANAYITAGEHQKAVELLSLLVENEPDNIIYSHTLATEYYYLGAQKLDEIIDAYGQQKSVATLLSEADSLINAARDQYEKARSSSPGDSEIQLAFARFYQNAATKYQKVLPAAPDGEQSRLKQRIKQYLTSSIPLYKNLAQQNPDSSEFWSSLYQVYSYLGMSEEARQVKSKIN